MLRSLTRSGGDAAPTASYEEYVAARWSALYRTAYLMTGNHADAEDLVQTALIKVYAAWGEVAAAASADAYVRRILANTFLSGRRALRVTRERLVDRMPEVPEMAPGSEDRLSIWPHVASLPPKQRAVVVLRYYEDLSEQQIAVALGCSPGTVKSNASLALKSLKTRMSAAGRRAAMNIEQMLTDELRTVATGLAVPAAPVQRLRQEGHDRVVRRRKVAGVAAGLVAAAVAVMVASLSGTFEKRAEQDPAVPSLRNLPSGPAPSIPYVWNGDLHVNGKVVPGEFTAVSGKREPLLVLGERGSAGIFENGEITAFARDVHYTELSENGRWLAYMSNGDTRLVVRDLRDGEEVHLGFPGNYPGDRGFTWLRAVDDQGRAYVGADLRVGRMFDPATGRLVELQYEGIPMEAYDSWGPGPMAQSAQHDRAAPGMFALVAADGTVTSAFPTVDADFEAGPDAKWGISTTDRNGVPEYWTDGEDPDALPMDSLTVVPLAGGEPRTFVVVKDVRIEIVGWEDENVVLVQFMTLEVNEGGLARCDVRNGRCEFAVPPSA
jgi:RNA polymerase sigma-70 factor (sigma-E family)